jgi:hypothetical protein
VLFGTANIENSAKFPNKMFLAGFSVTQNQYQLNPAIPSS